MIFVFAALLEFAFVNSLVRRSQKYEKLAKQAHIELGGKTKSVHAVNGFLGDSMRRLAKKYSHSGLLVDKMCRISFPSAFVVFNICYWIKYNILKINVK